MLLYVIIAVIIIALIVKLSTVQDENTKLLSDKCRNDTYEEYKRKSTKSLNRELHEIAEEYHKRLDYYIKEYKEQYGSECMTQFGYNEEKLINGGESFMRYDKNDMKLYYRYNVICEILDKRK